MTRVDEYDVVVVGAGPTGEVAAQRVRRGGLSVAVVERRLVGGECSYFACIPTKAMLRPVHATRAAQRVRGSVGAQLTPADVLARRDHFAPRTDDGQVSWLSDEGIALVRGSARLVGEREVAVGDRTLHARHAVVVATGSAAAVPDIPGLVQARPWTNVEATSTPTVPGRLTVLGGGVVGCELAQTFAALGSQVVLAHRGPRLLERVEPFAAEAVLDALRRDGVDVRLDTAATSVHRGGDGEVQVSLGDGSTVRADEVLCALGRVPATSHLGLDGVGITPDERGFLPVDETCAVRGAGEGQPWLYAVGDVTGAALLTHMGKYQARVCGDAIVARAAGASLDDPALRASSTDGAVTQVIFTDPEVAAVGPTAEQERSGGLDVRTVDVPMSSAAGAGLQADHYTGTARLLVDEATGTVVGATFVGQDTADLLHAATVAVVGQVPLARLWHAVPAFPTMSEVWLRLLEEYGC